MFLHATPAPTDEMIRRIVTYARTAPGEYVLLYEGCFPRAGPTRARNSAPRPRQTQNRSESQLVRKIADVKRRGFELNVRTPAQKGDDQPAMSPMRPRRSEPPTSQTAAQRRKRSTSPCVATPRLTSVASRRRQMTTLIVMTIAHRNQKNLKITGMFSV